MHSWAVFVMHLQRVFGLQIQPVSCNTVSRVQSLQAAIMKLAYWTIIRGCVDDAVLR